MRKLNAITLIVDFNNDQGDIKISDQFLQLDGLTKADMLKDWKIFLENEYDLALEEMHNAR